MSVISLGNPFVINKSLLPSKSTSKNLKNLTAPFFYFDSGLYKYCSGNFSNLENAKKHQSELVTLGFKDCLF